MIEGIYTRRVESTPANDPTLGTASRQQQEQRGDRQPGAGSSSFGDTLTLSTEAQQQLSKLQQRDREVRSHEQAHISAGGQHVSGGASYSYSKGPDGRQYAIGGSVSIDTSPIAGDPEATQEKARMVRSAALAPGQPSAQDQNVAAQAATMEMQAQTEKRTQSDGGSQTGQNPQQNTNTGTVAAPTQPSQSAKAGDAVQSATASTSQQAEQAAQGKESAPDGVEAASSRNANAQTASTLVTPFASSADGNRNTGFLHSAMEMQVRSDKVAALYQAQQNKFIPPTALAPNGTGIAYTV